MPIPNNITKDADFVVNEPIVADYNPQVDLKESYVLGVEDTHMNIAKNEIITFSIIIVVIVILVLLNKKNGR